MGLSAACGSGSLLVSRGRGMSPQELNNADNDPFGQCVDGSAGTFHSDESLDAITVTSAWVLGEGWVAQLPPLSANSAAAYGVLPGGRTAPLTTGRPVDISIKVYCYGNGADVLTVMLSSADVLVLPPQSVDWQVVASNRTCTSGGTTQAFVFRTTLPQPTNGVGTRTDAAAATTSFAVRAVWGYCGGGSLSAPECDPTGAALLVGNSCPISGYTDVDTLLFTAFVAPLSPSTGT